MKNDMEQSEKYVSKIEKETARIAKKYSLPYEEVEAFVSFIEWTAAKEENRRCIKLLKGTYN